MCSNPVTIPNPYYESQGYEYIEGDVLPLNERFFSSKPTIQVPCGNCPDCRESHYSAILQRAQMESITSYVYFVTLTYDDKHIPKMSFVRDDGVFETLYYADLSHIQNMIKRMRNHVVFRDRGLRYFSVVEYGTNRFRPHHHMLLFVARKDGDDLEFPVRFESKLSLLLQRYYAVNIGTRKHPKYESLFTYAERFVNGKWHRNFDCRLVRDCDMDTDNPLSINSPVSVARSIQYLISYVRKPSRFDEQVQPLLDRLGYLDSLTHTRLFRLLKSRCVYSKHFGFGFNLDGSKVVPHPRSFSLTSRLYDTERLLAAVPATEAEFASLYPGKYASFLKFVNCSRSIVDFYFENLDEYTVPSLSSFLSSLTAEQHFYFRLIFKYDPNFGNSLIARMPILTSNYCPVHLPYGLYDDSYKSSIVYRTIRKYVESGIRNRSPFLSFEFLDKDGNVIRVPLCKYFRRYCCTYYDVAALYRSLRVQNYDDYCELFEYNDQLTIKRARKEMNNEDKHEISREYEDYGVFSRNYLFLSNIKNIFVPRVDVFELLKS